MDRFDQTRLREALTRLGALLDERGASVRLLAVGGATLLLQGWSSRTTVDIDIVASRRRGRWVGAQPLPKDLQDDVAGVAQLLGLPADKPWLNAGPAFLFDMGLPKGWEQRTTSHHFGGLTIETLGREDIIALKLCAAASPFAPGRRGRDAGDLRALGATRDELLAAARWCSGKDGTGGFFQSGRLEELFGELGFDITATEVHADD